MKIRICFVSNSSSSSFVIFGKRITNPLASIKNGKRVFVHLDGGGTSGEAEDWGMWIDEECLNLLEKSNWFKRFSNPDYFECSNGFEEDKKEYDRIIVSDDIKEQQIFAFNRDYSSPNNIKQLKKFLKDVERWLE